MQTIDLRSDTVTKPTPGMREAMLNAPVGDDVIDVDPTVLELQEYVAGLLGKEAAIFMPSGTMTNQIALRVHCIPGDEFLCEAGCHIYNYEQGAFAQLSGLVAKTIEGQNGLLDLEQMHGTVRPESEHTVRTKLLCLENTHNRGAGKIYSLSRIETLCDWAHSQGLKTHLDGARLFNASVASRVSLHSFSEPFGSVSVCFSKGLGASGWFLFGGHPRLRRQSPTCKKTLWWWHEADRNPRCWCFTLSVIRWIAWLMTTPTLDCLLKRSANANRCN